MADLKVGSTVGGSHIWTQGNLALLPNQDSLFYKGHKVFTFHDRPTAQDVDAVSASQGGDYLKSVHFAEGLTVGSASAGDTKKNGIFKGSKDAADFTGVSWELRSWKSIGFVNARDNTITGYIDTTTGEFHTKGSVNAVRVLDEGQRVYSPANKPTNEELDLVSRHGDTVRGTYNFISSKLVLSPDSKILTDKQQNIASFNADNIDYGAGTVVTRLFTKERVKVITNGAEGLIYDTNHKPTAADVGLGRVTNDEQVKKAGDRMTGNLQAPRVMLENDPVSDIEAIRFSFLKENIPFPLDKIIDDTVDWDDIVKRGVYRVTGGGGTTTPEGDVSEGIMIVNVTHDGLVMQNFFPFATDHAVAWRVKGEDHSDRWSAWRYVMERKVCDTRYVRSIGDTMTGTLRVPYDHGVRTVDRVVGPETRSVSLFDTAWGTGIYRHSNQKKGQAIVIGDDDQLYFYQHTNTGQDALKNKVYHTNNKPTAADVKAVALGAVIDFGTF